MTPPKYGIPCKLPPEYGIPCKLPVMAVLIVVSVHVDSDVSPTNTWSGQTIFHRTASGRPSPSLSCRTTQFRSSLISPPTAALSQVDIKSDERRHKLKIRGRSSLLPVRPSHPAPLIPLCSSLLSRTTRSNPMIGLSN
jgi:hypothetical protein